jgi:hypothetical protein
MQLQEQNTDYFAPTSDQILAEWNLYIWLAGISKPFATNSITNQLTCFVFKIFLTVLLSLLGPITSRFLIH